MPNKINSLLDLEKIIKNIKKRNIKIILCHGVFDLIHIGHIKHLKNAKLKGSKLIVSVTADKFIFKGSNRPIFNIDQRVEVLSSLEFVDFVCISNEKDSINIIKSLKPDYYVKGLEYKSHKKDITGKILEEINMVKKYGGKIKYTNDLTFSSSKIINSFGDTLNVEQKKFIDKIKKKYTINYIISKLDYASSFSIITIGEAIIDQYNFCEVLGKSGKESFLSFKETKSFKYLGGIFSHANHLSSFCKSVSILSFIGEKKQNLTFIKSKIAKNIKTIFLKKLNSPTILKKRYLDSFDNRKIMGVYDINDSSISVNEEKLFLKKIRESVINKDILIIADYGHGIITKKIANFLSKLNIFTCLNTQINSTNYGTHNIDKYRNIDCVVINETELRHEMRDKDSNIIVLSKKLINKIKAKKIIVTRGNQGAIILSKNGKYIKCPAFAVSIKDKIGAGDAMQSILALLLKLKIEDDLSIFIASIAASQSVNVLANSSYLDKKKILKQISHMLL